MAGKGKGRRDTLQTLPANTSEAPAASTIPTLPAAAGGGEAENAFLLFLALQRCHYNNLGLANVAVQNCPARQNSKCKGMMQVKV